MKKQDAALKFCPLIRDCCMTDSCMAWSRTSVNNTYQKAIMFIEEIAEYVSAGQNIHAIKRLRETLCVTLKEAKDMQEDGSYPLKIRQHFNAMEERSDSDETGYCIRFRNTLGQNETVIQPY